MKASMEYEMYFRNILKCRTYQHVLATRTAIDKCDKLNFIERSNLNQLMLIKETRLSSPNRMQVI